MFLEGHLRLIFVPKWELKDDMGQKLSGKMVPDVAGSAANPVIWWENKLGVKLVLHVATHTHVPKKNPNSVPAKTKGKRSGKNPGSFCCWQSRDTVAQAMCCTQALISYTLCCCFYRQPKLTLILACAQILATLWQRNLSVI